MVAALQELRREAHSPFAVPVRRRRYVLAVGLTVTMACTSGLRSVPEPNPTAPHTAYPPIPGAPAEVTAFTDVAVIPMDTGRVLPHYTVLVRRGRIAALGPVDSIAVPHGAIRIDGRNKYLVPGFGACHGHMISSWSAEAFPLESRYAELVLFSWFADGVTVVREMDYIDADAGISNWFPLRGRDLLRLRAQAAAGRLWSPRLYITGQWAPKQYIIGGTHSLARGEDWPEPRLDSVAAYVAAFKAAGYDFLKLHEESPTMADSVFAAARRVGIQVGGHVVGTFEQALAGGQQVMDHFGKMGGWPASDTTLGDSAAYRQLLAANAGARRRAGVWTCLGGYGVYNSLELRALTDSGAGVLLGDDGLPGNSALPRLKQAGLTPYQALALGTKNFGRYLRTLDPRGDETGTIAVGQRADLVLLTGNPLADLRYADPHDESLGAAASPAVVMVGGRWLARPELDRRLAVRGLYKSLLEANAALLADALDSSLTPSQRQAVQQLEPRHQAQRFALAERFVLSETKPAGGADSLRGPQLLVELFAQQLGEVRAVLPATAQPRFDVQAHRWLTARAAEGYHPTIPGIRP